MAHRPEYFFEKITAWIGSTPSFIVHTILFIGAFGAAFLGYIDFSQMLLVLTTIVSLEAIYLSIFIQMTVNRQSAEIQEVADDVEDIQEDIEEISEDVEEIQEDVEEISDMDDWNLENGAPVVPGPAVTIEQLTEDVKSILAKLQELQKK